MKNIGNHLFSLKIEDNTVVFNASTLDMYLSKDLINEEIIVKTYDFKEARNIKPIELTNRYDINTIVVSCAETCNLKCTYCFANEGTYNNIENKIMKTDDYDKLLKYILEMSYPIKAISLFGGEPLLGLDYIKEFLFKLEGEYLIRQWKFPVIGIVTNGTLIDQDTIDLFNKYNVFVTISLDGEKKINDRNRIYENPKKSVYDTIKNNLKLMKNKKFILTAAATLSKEVLDEYKYGDYSEYLNHFEQLGFDYVEHFIADENEELTDKQIESIKTLAKEQVEVTFDRLLSDNLYVPLAPLGLMSSIIRKEYKPECAAGIKQVYYTAEGEVYPCQLYYTARRKTRVKISRTEFNPCSECFCVKFCNAYCPGNSVLRLGKETGYIESRCIYQKALAKETIMRMFLIISDKSKSNMKLMEGINKFLEKKDQTTVSGVK